MKANENVRNIQASSFSKDSFGAYLNNDINDRDISNLKIQRSRSQIKSQNFNSDLDRRKNSYGQAKKYFHQNSADRQNNSFSLKLINGRTFY
mmetsp:Transcript_20609/g.18249  ORF Transcript_20609/g.18249 Transcript_20609/m.18249 type:complete len:92 (+) Transcript_20609:854-1129(+)